MSFQEHADEMWRSRETIDTLAPTLLADARELLREAPTAQVAGVIAERGAPEYAKVRTMLEQDTGTELVPDLLFGIVRLPFAMKLAAEGPATVLDHFRAFATMSPRMLPVLMATKNGVQAAGYRLFPAKGGRG